MATISTGSAKGGRKAVDAEVPLIPFIDLLLCCVMFLLVAAVWNDLAALTSEQRVPGEGEIDDPAPEAPLVLSIREDGYELSSSAGDRTSVPRRARGYDQAALGRLLEQRHELAPDARQIVIAPDDGIPFDVVAGAMDTA